MNLTILSFNFVKVDMEKTALATVLEATFKALPKLWRRKKSVEPAIDATFARVVDEAPVADPLLTYDGGKSSTVCAIDQTNDFETFFQGGLPDLCGLIRETLYALEHVTGDDDESCAHDNAIFAEIRTVLRCVSDGLDTTAPSSLKILFAYLCIRLEDVTASVWEHASLLEVFCEFSERGELLTFAERVYAELNVLAVERLIARLVVLVRESGVCSKHGTRDVEALIDGCADAFGLANFSVWHALVKMVERDLGVSGELASGAIAYLLVDTPEQLGKRLGRYQNGVASHVGMPGALNILNTLTPMERSHMASISA